MSAAAPSLRRLQQVFRDLGINDDVQIAGHVAFLLLVRDDWGDLRRTSRYDLHGKLPMVHQGFQQQYPGLQHIPEPPPVRRLGEHTLASMIDLLEQAIHQSPHNQSLGVFFSARDPFRTTEKHTRRAISDPLPYCGADSISWHRSDAC